MASKKHGSRMDYQKKNSAKTNKQINSAHKFIKKLLKSFKI